MPWIILGGLCCYVSGVFIGRGLPTGPRHAAHLLGLIGMGLAAWGFWHAL